MPAPLAVAVVGTGSLGSIHARVVSELPEARLVGVHDTDPARAARVAGERGCPVLADLDAVAAAADAVIVAVPTRSHLEVARVLLERGVPCLVEKPLASDTDEGRQLVEIARQKAVPLMVGHVERFNPIVVALLERGLAPRFAEAHRVSPYSFRSADVGVVMDVMIHDIDLILHLIPSPVRSVHAVGFGVLGEHEDLANARVIFEDGSVANVTASRLALKTERKLRLFAPDCYVSLDLLKKVGRIVRPGPGLQREIERAKADLGSMNPLQIMLKRLVRTESISAKHGEEPLKAEDREFLAAVREARDPAVSGEHGLLAMEAARLVQASIRENLSRA